MNEQQASQVRRTYGILLSLVLVIAGICLMYGCCSIYYSDEGTFSREIVAAQFSVIAIPVYLCVVMVIAGFLLDLFLPLQKKKRNVEVNYSLILQRLHEKTDLSQCGSTLAAAVAKEQRSRKCHKTVSLLLLIVGSLIFLPYGLNGANFHQQEITDSLIRALYLLVPCMAVPFGYAVFTAYYSRASIRREIDLMKQIGTNRSPVPTAKAVKSADWVKWGVLAVAVTILVYGYLAGGTADVLTKAINICTECVGLG